MWATNESGFTALPGGLYWGSGDADWLYKGESAAFYQISDEDTLRLLDYNNPSLSGGNWTRNGASVPCIKDP